jgi:GNAT superfamily N-acetyltransferase
MQVEIVSTAEWPALAEVTAQWRWDAFARDGERSFAQLLADERLAAAAAEMPRTLVAIEEGRPVGMASLVAHDLEERPDLGPWLAGVFVLPECRRQGYAARLVRAVEAISWEASIDRLWLYTRTAERLYASLGWIKVEDFERSNRNRYALMRRDRSAAAAPA